LFLLLPFFFLRGHAEHVLVNSLRGHVMEIVRADAERCVLNVLARKTGADANKISMESRLLHDLGLDGDDAIEAIQEISDKCSIDIAGFSPTEYFRSEPSLLSLLWFLPSQKRDRLSEKRPITVRQLIDAARKGYLRT
jgi:acyl carrier protein